MRGQPEENPPVFDIIVVELGETARPGRRSSDIRIPDIGFAIVRFSRPVAPGLTLEEERAIAHRHLDIYLDGLQTDGHKTTPLAAPHAMDQFDPASG